MNLPISTTTGVVIPDELREKIIERLCEVQATHLVVGTNSYCRCGKKIYSGEPGSMTLARHRAEKMLEEMLSILGPAAFRK